MQYNSINLSVHHIAKVESNWDKRFEMENLITLCGRHHVMADDGRITSAKLQWIVKKLQNNPPGGTLREGEKTATATPGLKK